MDRRRGCVVWACQMAHKSKNEAHNGDLPEPIGVIVYKSTIVVSWDVFGGNGGGGCVRDRISFLSDKSLRRLAFIAQNTDVEMTHMITLTYPKEYPMNGREVKESLNRLLSFMRARAKKNGTTIGYIWFLEFQRRGAPHVHIICDGLYWSNSELSYRWYKAVGSGDKAHLRAGTRQERIRERDGAAKYVTKYALKTEQKKVPDGFVDVGRFWGASRNACPVPLGAKVMHSRGELVEFLGDWEYVGRLEWCTMKYLYSSSAHCGEYMEFNKM